MVEARGSTYYLLRKVLAPNVMIGLPLLTKPSTRFGPVAYEAVWIEK